LHPALEKNRSWVVGSCGLRKWIGLKRFSRRVGAKKFKKECLVVDGRPGNSIIYAAGAKSLTQLGEASRKMPKKQRFG
jgi:hypothetical protein